MKNIPGRITISTKDVMRLTGKSERTARRLLTRIRRYHGKPGRSLLTVEEFCLFTGFNAIEVMEALR